MSELVKAAQPQIMALLSKYQSRINNVLPRHLTPERMLSVIASALNKNPALLQCKPSTLLDSIVYLSMLGLEPRPGQAYLIPYGTNCVPVIDYRGKIDLARRSGVVRDIEPHIVYEADEFDLVWSTDPQKRGIVHKQVYCKKGPNGKLLRVSSADRGQPVLGYAIGWLSDGQQPHVEVMTFDEIEHVRAKSRAAKDGPWVTDWDEMGRKTLVHRICKYLPQSVELATAQELDDRADLGLAADSIIEIDPADDKPIIAQSKQLAAEVADEKIAKLKAQQTSQPEPPVQQAVHEDKGDVEEAGQGSASPEPTEEQMREWDKKAEQKPQRRLNIPRKA